MSWVFKRNRIDTIFEREDVYGNKILNVSRLGLHSNLRYIEWNEVVYISVVDLLNMFGGNTDSIEDTWRTVAQDIKNQIYVHLHEFNNHVQQEDSHHLYRICVAYIDAVKILWGLDLDNTTKCKNIEIFLAYYQIRFFHNKLKPSRISKCTCDYLYNYLLLGAVVLGFMGAVVIFYACNLIKQ